MHYLVQLNKQVDAPHLQVCIKGEQTTLEEFFFLSLFAHLQIVTTIIKCITIPDRLINACSGNTFLSQRKLILCHNKTKKFTVLCLKHMCTCVGGSLVS